jgi:hypothetical protein
MDSCESIRRALQKAYNDPDGDEGLIFRLERKLHWCESRPRSVGMMMHGAAPLGIDPALLDVITSIGKGTQWIDPWLDDWCPTPPFPPRVPWGVVGDLVSQVLDHASQLPQGSKRGAAMVNELGQLLQGVAKRMNAKAK